MILTIFTQVQDVKNGTSTFVNRKGYIINTNNKSITAGLSVITNICYLKTEHHETQHVGPLGTLKWLYPNRFMNFDLKIFFKNKSRSFKYS